MSGSVLEPSLPPEERDPDAEQVLGAQAQVRRVTKTSVQGWSGPARSGRALKKYAGYLSPGSMLITWDQE